MSTKAEGDIRVGHVQVPMATATGWVRDYTNAEKNTTGSAPYAYPAYDRYSKVSNDPLLLTDGDFLAPVLLNVRLSIRSFYALQRSREVLEECLANEDLARPLAEIEDPDRIDAMVKPLYAVLDDPATKPWGVEGTTLSKVLHRKRPQSLVLHDVWVRACYVSDNGPVPRARKRSWADYMAAVTRAIGDDIRTQKTQFERLDEASREPGELSPVRLLDILAWKSQGHTPADEVEVSDQDGQ
jgi:Family of unknown function (DUF6308)